MDNNVAVNWEERIIEILKNTESSDADFDKGAKAMSKIHEGLLEALRKEWNDHRIPALKERAFQIDFVGREYPTYGKVELAIEVDTGHIPTGNWIKLLDINAANKFWVYLRREPIKADVRFKEALKKFRELASMRKEDKANDVILLMKVADKTDIEKHHLFE